MDKKSFEVLDELQEITQPLREYATVLNMLIGHFNLSDRELSDLNKWRLVDGYDDIYNTIMLVLRGLLDIDDKINNFDLQKKSSDPEPTESAN